MDQVEVDTGAVAGGDVGEVLLVSERQARQVVHRIALARLGPVDDAGELVTVNEDVADLQVPVREHRYPWPERGLGDLAVTRDQVGGKDAARDEPLAFAGEACGELVAAPPTRPRRQRRVVQRSDRRPRRGPRRRRGGRRLTKTTECHPWEGSDREHG